MAKSAKAKKEKQKDFQKTKLKVGKVKPKPANFTDTSFKARSVAILHQSLSSSAPSIVSQFQHHLNLLSHKSDSQRRESLAYLTAALHGHVPPVPVSLILPKIQPLIRDPSAAVRSQLLKFLSALPPADITPHAEPFLLHVRAGMTHLSAAIRLSSLDILEWLLNTAGSAVVSCPGGWLKTLRCFFGLLAWEDASVAAPQAWKATAATAGKNDADLKLLARQLQVLTALLECGLREPVAAPDAARAAALRLALDFPLCDAAAHGLRGHASNPFAYLNIFGAAHDDESRECSTVDERRDVFSDQGLLRAARAGLERVKREGGGVGRAAIGVEKALGVFASA
ncbi:hypothetical protein EJ06DRAFT_323812 [Trichodelitschia bisporula]|uniref:Pre-rRNA-processing protein n=1 Tax=Trichodelitschia bisporula TaxID=703511 RepID=A0A6G1I4K4_9PEZI|nr:hypothetical protein EJ06DRAFT_323812 [Trichodelitschia bisporula]